uniref:Uncharacterized protein n=1 Tax=Anopheles farauti TaxID=69004 RepID=A0A182QTB1_9DIPT
MCSLGLAQFVIVVMSTGNGSSIGCLLALLVPPSPPAVVPAVVVVTVVSCELCVVAFRKVVPSAAVASWTLVAPQTEFVPLLAFELLPKDMAVWDDTGTRARRLAVVMVTGIEKFVYAYRLAVRFVKHGHGRTMVIFRHNTAVRTAVRTAGGRGLSGTNRGSNHHTAIVLAKVALGNIIRSI